MSEQFCYLQFSLNPKSGSGDNRQVALELPLSLIEDWKAEKPDQHLTDQSIAVEIAKVVALDSVLTFPHRCEYEFVDTNLFDERHRVMNARPCDHHDNGIRAWVLRSSDLEGHSQSST
jgi:hypothetical protein